jgi:hypothetical protein
MATESDHYLRCIAGEILQDIQMLYIVRIGKVGNEISLFVIKAELLVIGQDVIGKIDKKN